MYKTPLFPHIPYTNDYILIRIKSPYTTDTTTNTVPEDPSLPTLLTSSSSTNQHPSKRVINLTSKSIIFVIRKMPSIYVAGQIEPLKIVPRPSVRNMMTKVQEKMVSMYTVYIVCVRMKYDRHNNMHTNMFI